MTKDDTLPRCPECGYTKEDALIHWDHHLCKGKIPGYDTRPPNHIPVAATYHVKILDGRSNPTLKADDTLPRMTTGEEIAKWVSELDFDLTSLSKKKLRLRIDIALSEARADERRKIVAEIEAHAEINDLDDSKEWSDGYVEGCLSSIAIVKRIAGIV